LKCALIRSLKLFFTRFCYLILIDTCFFGLGDVLLFFYFFFILNIPLLSYSVFKLYTRLVKAAFLLRTIAESNAIQMVSSQQLRTPTIRSEF
jgi:hypothetical protein